MQYVKSDTFVRFRTRAGISFAGSILQLNRYVVEFETDEATDLQLSESLKDVRLVLSNREQFVGGMLVQNLTHSETGLVVKAKLDPQWSEGGFFAFTGTSSLVETCQQLLAEWGTFHQIDATFKLAVYEMQGRLLELQRFLGRTERTLNEEGRDAQFEYDSICENWSFFDKTFAQVFAAFEVNARTLPNDLEPAHHLFVRRQLHPILLLSPFMQRAYLKPLGFAGDYEMIRMILADSYCGASLFSRVLNRWVLEQPPAAAHRNRILFLREHLKAEIQRREKAGRITILSIGAGPAQEIEQLVQEVKVQAEIVVELIDFNHETVQYLIQRASELKGAPPTEWRILPHVVEAQKIARFKGWKAAPYDVIYCAGLCDYLTDRACRLLVQAIAALLTPGGALFITNVAEGNPVRSTMEYLLEWFLHHRKAGDLSTLLRHELLQDVSVSTDSTGVNLFAELRRIDHSSAIVRVLPG